MSRQRRTMRRLAAVAALWTMITAALLGTSASAGAAVEYDRLSGSGSSWSGNAVKQWVTDVRPRGLVVDFNANGSSAGRSDFRSKSTDFAVTDIQYGLTDASGAVDPPPSRGYAYMPIVAGGTSFMYNLRAGGRQITNLRLSGENVARIFTGVVTKWNDPAIAADNPGLALPAIDVVPVVRSDGSGASAQFSAFLANQYPDLWNAYCAKANFRSNPCPFTSFYPTVAGSNFVAAQGSDGVQNAVRQESGLGTIGYEEYSYALTAFLPVAKVLNKGGYYVEPTASNVAVALEAAQIDTSDPTNPATYLTQKLQGVYANPDPRAYPVSSYSYFVLPTDLAEPFTVNKGKALGDFAYYFLCQGQQKADVLGYSPLPRNLVEAGLEQIRKVPGVDVQNINVASCNNPTFSSSGENLLALNAPQPKSCDRNDPQQQCPDGTGGAREETPVTTPNPVAGAAPGGPEGQPGGTAAAQSQAAAANGSGAGGTGTTGGAAGGAAGGGAAGGAGPAGVPGGQDGAGGVPGALGGVAGSDVLGGDPALDGLGGDPAFGGDLAVGGGTGPAYVAGQPVSVLANSGWQLKYALIICTALAFVIATVGPALMARRFGGRK